ncbi:ClpXP protease specificity-enhancing factor [Vibrio natriegens]|uniref:ClpXP protease specificity-enhancing factor n=1 Tax=Vibrio natriegens TaxID=691 RepID=UPI0021E6E0A5|nr:ClpXP protease specificity-enhancing factor [Vibrio natriegens]UYI47520.1 ClpXP protease specificity-enhancing factor [Vibrio natriegens]
MDIAKMTARRPYMLRAFYDWLVDNDLTPHLVVDATMPGVRVPVEFIQDGQIILNIAPRAVGNLELGNDAITFHARFSGRPHSVIVPVYAVQAIYARENGAGTMFEPEEAYTNIEEETLEEEQSPSFTTVSDDAQVADSESGDSESEAPRPKGKPSLRVIK